MANLINYWPLKNKSHKLCVQKKDGFRQNNKENGNTTQVKVKGLGE